VARIPFAAGVALLVVGAAAAAAEESAPPVATSAEWIVAGARQLTAEEPEFELQLYVSNSGDEPVEVELPAAIRGVVQADSGTEPVRLYAADPDPEPDGAADTREAAGQVRSLAPGAFATRRYQGLLPLHAHGIVRLQLDLAGVAAVHFPVVAAELHRSDPYAWGLNGADTNDDLIDRILSGLLTYEPVYFVAGGDLSPVTAKFQLSAQYRILIEPRPPLDPEGFWEHFWYHAQDLYLGYTQTSVWELSSPSAPFRDSSFRPAIYYFESDLLRDGDLPWDRLGLQVGLEHESNGQGGDDSRSLNIAFVRPILTFDVGSHHHFTVAPKIYAYIEKQDNKDIDHYRGYVDLLLKFGRIDGFELSTTLRKGTKKAYGSVQVDATYPIARISKYFGAFLQVQFFYGYGDTLLNYDRNANVQLRGGLGIVPYGSLYP
jgi:outer membrane phospholipase A